MEKAKSGELVEKIEAELTCAVCSDRFCDPKVLPCLHTYCRKCVENLAKEESPEDDSVKVLCPLFSMGCFKALWLLRLWNRHRLDTST